eukprot:1183903-Prorocentrum_minimum.AAC.2
MLCAEWYTSIDSQRLSTVQLKSKAFSAVGSGAWLEWVYRSFFVKVESKSAVEGTKGTGERVTSTIGVSVATGFFANDGEPNAALFRNADSDRIERNVTDRDDRRVYRCVVVRKRLGSARKRWDWLTWLAALLPDGCAGVLARLLFDGRLAGGVTPATPRHRPEGGRGRRLLRVRERGKHLLDGGVDVTHGHLRDPDERRSAAASLDYGRRLLRRHHRFRLAEEGGGHEGVSGGQPRAANVRFLPRHQHLVGREQRREQRVRRGGFVHRAVDHPLPE